MMVLEQAVFNMNDVLVEIQQALRPELRSTGLRGPTPQDGPQEVDRPSDRPPPEGTQSPQVRDSTSKSISVPMVKQVAAQPLPMVTPVVSQPVPPVPKPVAMVTPMADHQNQPVGPKAASTSEVQPDPQEGPKAAIPSPAYQVPEDSVWNQSALSKALQLMKETDFTKLKFTPGLSKPLEYEKWMNQMATAMNGHHPEIGIYWQRVVKCAEETYARYVKDVSFTRTGIFPTEKLPQTPIEERIEARLLMMMNSVVPQVVVRQCDDKPDVTCVLLIYRTMVLQGQPVKRIVHR